MIKLIFLVVIGIVLFAFTGESLATFTGWFTEGISNFVGAFGLIATILGALTFSIFDYVFIRYMLIAGVLVFVIDYLVKLITGHHLETHKKEKGE